MMMQPYRLLFILLAIVATTTTTTATTDSTDAFSLDKDETISIGEAKESPDVANKIMVLSKKEIKKWKKPVFKDSKTYKWEISYGDGGFKKDYCTPRLPDCCTWGTEMLWKLGKEGKYTLPGMVAQQPTVYNPQCFNSIDFDTIPLSSGQPFCNEFTIGNASNMKAASLHAIIYSKPPYKNTIQDRFCLTTASGKEWCTMLQPGENKFCLDLDELGLIDDGGMSTLLARTVYHSSVDYLRLHVIFCLNVSTLPPVTSTASIHYEFENNLDSVIASVPPFLAVLNTPSYFSDDPRGKAVQFKDTPDVFLEMPNDVSQQGGSAIFMALWVYFDEPDPDLWGAGITLVSKGGSYRWMMIPGYDWTWMHVHLGPGFGDLIFAQRNPDNTDFQIPLKKWLCMAVTIDADSLTGTTTLHYYLNGQLWGPPTVANQVYNMDGTQNLTINGYDDGINWAGKVDTFALWKSILHPKDVSRFCKYEP